MGCKTQWCHFGFAIVAVDKIRQGESLMSSSSFPLFFLGLFPTSWPRHIHSIHYLSGCWGKSEGIWRRERERETQMVLMSGDGIGQVKLLKFLHQVILGELRKLVSISLPRKRWSLVLSFPFVCAKEIPKRPILMRSTKSWVSRWWSGSAEKWPQTTSWSRQHVFFPNQNVTLFGGTEGSQTSSWPSRRELVICSHKKLHQQHKKIVFVSNFRIVISTQKTIRRVFLF